MVTVFLNGRFLGRDEAKISAFDAGLQHGVGLFETMLAMPGDLEPSVVALGEHIDRLIVSARLLGLSESLRRQALGEAVVETVKQSGITENGGNARVRLTVTGGDLNLLGRSDSGKDPRSGAAPSSGGSGGVQPSILIVAQPATVYPDEFFERGVAVTIADLKTNPLDPLAGHKTVNYWGRLRELQVAAAKKAGEALVFQVTNHLAGGCVSNAFIVKDGRLLTPIARGEEEEVAGEDDGDKALGQAGRGAEGAVMPSPVLPGVTRRAVLDAAEERGIKIDRRMLTIHDVLAADEAFLTNSSWGVLPVIKVEREAIGDGSVGPVTRQMRESVLTAWASG